MTESEPILAQAGTPMSAQLGAQVLTLAGVARSYLSGDKVLNVLKSIDLTLHAGEVSGLVGPSGSGKSTLLHIAGLLEKPDAGEVTFLGKDALKMGDRERTLTRRLQLGFVYQFHHLLPELSAVDNIAAPLMLNGVSRQQCPRTGSRIARANGPSRP